MVPGTIRIGPAQASACCNSVLRDADEAWSAVGGELARRPVHGGACILAGVMPKGARRRIGQQAVRTRGAHCRAIRRFSGAFELAAHMARPGGAIADNRFVTPLSGRTVRICG